MYVPKTVNITNEKKAVLIFIHGGNYVYGGTNTTVNSGTRWSNYSDIIIITISYRLGIKRLMLH